MIKYRGLSTIDQYIKHVKIEYKKISLIMVEMGKA